MNKTLWDYCLQNGWVEHGSVDMGLHYLERSKGGVRKWIKCITYPGNLFISGQWYEILQITDNKECNVYLRAESNLRHPVTIPSDRFDIADIKDICLNEFQSRFKKGQVIQFKNPPTGQPWNKAYQLHVTDDSYIYTQPTGHKDAPKYEVVEVTAFFPFNDESDRGDVIDNLFYPITEVEHLPLKIGNSLPLDKQINLLNAFIEAYS